MNYRFVKRRQGDPPKLYAKSNLAKDLLNWSPKYSDLNTILKSKWNVYKKLFINFFLKLELEKSWFLS